MLDKVIVVTVFFNYMFRRLFACADFVLTRVLLMQLNRAS